MPTKRLISALASDPPPSVTTLVKPNRTIAKYSGESKESATFANGTASVTITVAVMSPPVAAANSVHPSARAGSPAWAIAQPSHNSGTSIGSPGIRNSIDVIAPPYVPEMYIAVSRMIDAVIGMP